MSDEEQVREDQQSTEEQELVPLVPDQGEDEGDYGDDPGTSFSASIASKDWTVETLVSQLRKGRIDLSPSFQRRNAWLENRKSKLIESILLGFPIPQIVLAEDREKPGHYFVLDGKQRLLALRQFFVDRENPRDDGFEGFHLRSLEVLTELSRMDYADLEDHSPELVAKLDNHTIRTVVLSDWNSERMLLSLFLRLNTGSVPLSPQELRQALIPGRFIEWLDERSGELPALRTLLGNRNPDRRMADAELLLRYLAFANSPVPYRGNLKQFLDDTSRVFNDGWSSLNGALERSVDDFSSAVRTAQAAFGERGACRKWSGTKFERALNRAVFDVQISSFSLASVRDAIEAKGADGLVERFQHACVRDEGFIRAISTTTKTVDAFVTRHRVWNRIVETELETAVALPAPLTRA